MKILFLSITHISQLSFHLFKEIKKKKKRKFNIQFEKVFFFVSHFLFWPGRLALFISVILCKGARRRWFNLPRPLFMFENVFKVRVKLNCRLTEVTVSFIKHRFSLLWISWVNFKHFTHSVATLKKTFKTYHVNVEEWNSIDHEIFSSNLTASKMVIFFKKKMRKCSYAGGGNFHNWFH